MRHIKRRTHLRIIVNIKSRGYQPRFPIHVWTRRGQLVEELAWLRSRNYCTGYYALPEWAPGTEGCPRGWCLPPPPLFCASRGARRARVIFREIELHRGFNNGVRPFPVCFEQTKSSPGEICAIDWAIIREEHMYMRSVELQFFLMDFVPSFPDDANIFIPSYIVEKRVFFSPALFPFTHVDEQENFKKAKN